MGSASAEAIMQMDGHLLEVLCPTDPPLLHFYRWDSPSLTFGHFVALERHLDLTQARQRGLSWARRPTGGGIVFHLWDLAFSFLMPSAHAAFSPNPLENYHFVNALVLEAVQAVYPCSASAQLIQTAPTTAHFCMAQPTQYDVVYQGRKIAGAAQRRRKQGYLHQGTISLAWPEEELLRGVLLSQDVVEAMLHHSFAPLGKVETPEILEEARAKIEQQLTHKFMEKLGGDLVPWMDHVEIEGKNSHHPHPC